MCIIRGTSCVLVSKSCEKSKNSFQFVRELECDKERKGNKDWQRKGAKQTISFVYTFVSCDKPIICSFIIFTILFLITYYERTKWKGSTSPSPK